MSCNGKKQCRQELETLTIAADYGQTVVGRIALAADPNVLAVVSRDDAGNEISATDSLGKRFSFAEH